MTTPTEDTPQEVIAKVTKIDVKDVHGETTLDLLHIQQAMKKLGKSWRCSQPYVRIDTVDQFLAALVRKEEGEES